MKINCIIVDDEALARRGLEEYTRNIDFLEVKGVCKNAVQANMLLKSEQVDLIFLDIEMPLISGMDFLKSLNNPPKVIFTTAYSEYALESFAFDVVDYLVKPISFERFLQAVNKAYRLLEGNKVEVIKPVESKQDFIFVKVDKDFVKIKYDEILFIQGMQNYVMIFTATNKQMVLVPLKSVLEMLPADRFYQVHKSFIVSLEKVNAISGNQLVIGEHKIPISRDKKDEVVKLLMENKILKK